MVWCSICSKGIFTNFSCNSLGTTHLKIGLDAYLLNDSYASNKNYYQDHQSFQVFCVDCFNKGHYFSKIMQKYPGIFQNYAESYSKTQIVKHQNEAQQLKKKIILAQEQQKKLLNDLNQYNSLDGLYKRFQSHYKEDKKKMVSLESFKKFGKQMALKDYQFKKKLDALYLKMEKEYLNSSIVRIQCLFSAYTKQMDQKIRLCEEDIKRVRQLQYEVISKCSVQKSSFCKQNLMNQDKLKSMEKIFGNQIDHYSKLLAGLKDFKNSRIIEFDIQEFQLTKANRSFYQMSDAQMHQNLWELNSFKK